MAERGHEGDHDRVTLPDIGTGQVVLPQGEIHERELQVRAGEFSPRPC
ncbi:hypothetical protein ABID95_005666 [Streptomyces atratus]